MVLQFIGLDSRSTKGRLFRSVKHQTMDVNKQFRAIPGDFELHTPSYLLQVENAKLRARSIASSMRVKDVRYVVELNCLCQSLEGVVYGTISTDENDKVIPYLRSDDEGVRNHFDDLLVANEQNARFVISTEDPIKMRLLAELSGDEMVDVLRSGALDNEHFDETFEEQFRGKTIRIARDPIGEKAIDDAYVLCDFYETNAELMGDLSEVVTSISTLRLPKLQYTLGNEKSRDFDARRESDFHAVFTQVVAETRQELHVETEDEADYASEVDTFYDQEVDTAFDEAVANAVDMDEPDYNLENDLSNEDPINGIDAFEMDDVQSSIDRISSIFDEDHSDELFESIDADHLDDFEDESVDYEDLSGDISYDDEDDLAL